MSKQVGGGRRGDVVLVLAYVLGAVFTVLTFFFSLVAIGARNAMKQDETINPAAAVTAGLGAMLCFLTAVLIRHVIEHGCL